MNDNAAVLIRSDDLTRGVDAICDCEGAQGVIKSRVGSADVEEAVVYVPAIHISPNDLSRAIYCVCRSLGAHGIIEGSEGINTHLRAPKLETSALISAELALSGG
jgi:hypothetical protein